MKSTFNSRTAVAASLICCMVSLNLGVLDAQNPPPARNVQLSFAQLDQLVASLALYPDPLVAQILVAATYSPQVVEAHRLLQHNAGLPPQDIARLVNTQRWDPSVKALTAFPSVLANLDQNLEWTTRLGDAYYNQPQDVMGAIQTMRDRAHKSGALHSTPQENVVYQPGTIMIQSVVATVVYVPVYNPWIVFGAPVPVNPAYVYTPPVAVAGVAVVGGVGFSAAVFVGSYGSYSWGYAHWGSNWYSHTVYYNQAPYVSRSVTVVNHGYYGRWDHSSTAVAYNRTVTGRGTGNVTATTTGPYGGTATRSTNYYAGGGSTSVTASNGAKETTTITGRGTGSATITRSGPRGSRSVTRNR
jgi:hypothetical protein